MPDAITIPTVALTTMPPVAYPLGPWEDVVSLAASSTERPMTASATRTESEALGGGCSTLFSKKWIKGSFEEKPFLLEEIIGMI